MILKIIQSVIKQFPTLTLADPSTRATRFLSWRASIQLQLVSAGTHLSAWWNWCESKAQKAHKAFVAASIHDRESILPEEGMPINWQQIDSWLRPRLIEVCPGDVKDWVNMRARQNKVDDTHVVLFYLYKQFAPGGADEKVQIDQSIRNPQVCSQPKAAQVELI